MLTKFRKILKEKGFSKKLLTVAGIIISLVIVYFIYKDLAGNWNSVKEYLMNVNWLIMLAAVVLYAFSYAMIGYNWASILWEIDKTHSRSFYLNIHIVSSFARYIPGGIWNIVGKAVMCTKSGCGKLQTSTSMVLEYIFQIISSGLFVLFFLPSIFNNSPLLIALISVLILVVILLFPKILNSGLKFISSKTKYSVGNVRFSKRFLIFMLLRFVIVWIITGISIVVMVLSMQGLDWNQIINLILSYPIAWVSGFLSPSPNGLGVREGVLKLLLGQSFDQEIQSLITVLTRVMTIAGEVLCFVFFKIIYHAKNNNRIRIVGDGDNIK